MAVARYISLTKLIQPLLALVDQEKLAVSVTADFLSDLPESEQNDLVAVMERLNVIPVKSQLADIKKHSKEGTLTTTIIEGILSKERPTAVQVVLKQAKLHQYFPKDFTTRQMEEVIVSLLETWSIQRK